MLSSSATSHYSVVCPDGVELSQAVELLHDHAFFIGCFPNVAKYEFMGTNKVPDSRVQEKHGVKAIAAAKQYQVTDQVPGIPKWIWNADLVSTYELIDIEKGVLVRIRGPLNTVVETVWEARETAEGGVTLASDLVIQCPRLVLGIVRGLCEEAPKRIHTKLVGKLREETMAKGWMKDEGVMSSSIHA
ncbi:hypothetical protein GQ602_004415 [Ophiocordyceps camponoti-floridani]|uniref:DUF7053 domain-containing protein n=1 Tax=Ophiocordyceps camponoti-floridani TaxID=2030778 RepID=A0A8H4VDL6_9HYPO|nr:hypothetical protein GQ602_004415 [Ophiocordyceps camponoti-floridani]